MSVQCHSRLSKLKTENKEKSLIAYVLYKNILHAFVMRQILADFLAFCDETFNMKSRDFSATSESDLVLFERQTRKFINC